MRSSRKFVAAFAGGLLAVGGLLAEQGDAGKPARKAAKEETKEARKEARDAAKKDGGGQEEKPAGEAKMMLPIPKGHDSKGLKIPYYDDQGSLQMTFTIGIANRLDEDHVKMSELQIETFGDDGAREMLIDLPQSLLDLSTRIITTNEGVTIRRTDFEITGQTMEFNTKTKEGRLTGRVRMLLYDPEEPSASAIKPTAAKTGGETSE